MTVGTQAPFSVSASPGLFSFHSFDHWIGDIPAGQNTATSGSVTMDGPKGIEAIYVFNFAFLGALGSVTGIVMVLGKFRNSRGIQKLLRIIWPRWIWRK